jgi:hypothetical protein
MVAVCVYVYFFLLELRVEGGTEDSQSVDGLISDFKLHMQMQATTTRPHCCPTES